MDAHSWFWLFFVHPPLVWSCFWEFIFVFIAKWFAVISFSLVAWIEHFIMLRVCLNVSHLHFITRFLEFFPSFQIRLFNNVSTISFEVGYCEINLISKWVRMEAFLSIFLLCRLLWMFTFFVCSIQVMQQGDGYRSSSQKVHPVHRRWKQCVSKWSFEMKAHRVMGWNYQIDAINSATLPQDQWSEWVCNRRGAASSVEQVVPKVYKFLTLAICQQIFISVNSIYPLISFQIFDLSSTVEAGGIVGFLEKECGFEAPSLSTSASLRPSVDLHAFHH